MRSLFILLFVSNVTFSYAGNVEIPEGNMVFYNSKEPGYFRITCNLLNSNSMSCIVEQLFFVKGPFDDCTISWTSHNDNFTFNVSNRTWNSISEQNNECGIFNFSTLSKTKYGEWSYKFGTHVRFPNKKTNGMGASCRAFENIAGIEYTSKYTAVNLKCNSFTFIPF